MNSPKLLHIGFLVSEDDFRKHSKRDPNPQVAARKLEGRFISGFKENGLHVTILSFFPATNFPGNPRCYFTFKRSNSAGFLNVSLPFINLLGLKHVTRFLAAFLFAFIWHLKNVGIQKRVAVYSVHSPFVLAALACKYLFGSHVYLIIPDLPSHMNFGERKSFLWRALKNFDVLVTDFLVSRSSAVSVVTADMIRDNTKWAKVPFVVVEGIASDEGALLHYLQPSQTQTKIFLYAGALSEQYGLRALLSAFEKLASMGADAELWICGRGAFVDEIKNFSSRMSCVKYLGYLSQSELQDVMRKTFCLVNLRDPSDAFVKYSFPSKLLEYLASGVPVLTTRLPGIPSEYNPFLNYANSTDTDVIVNAICDLLNQDFVELTRKAALGREFVLQNKTPAIQTSRFLRLMTRVESGEA